jgi:hypothetical protein
MQVNYPDTQKFCDLAIDSVPIYINRYADVFDVMNVTGCRVSEALDKSLWTFQSSSVWALKPNKESNTRLFSVNILPEPWKTYFADPDDDIHKINYRKVQYFLTTLFRPYGLKINEKYLLAHIYRHNYAKALQAQGHTVEDIAANLGHKSLTSTNYYLNSIITASKIPNTTIMRTNVAQRSNYPLATASSMFNQTYAPFWVQDGDRKGLDLNNGGCWNTGQSLPQWLKIDFGQNKTINEIDVFTVQDDYLNPIEPTLTTTFSLYGIKDFLVQYWNGTTWATIATVTNNSNIWRQFIFPPVTTSAIRIYVTATQDGFTRITELEAWTPS